MEAVFTVSVEFPEFVMLVGLKVYDAPEGKPLTVRLTLPVKPFRAEIVAV